MAVSHFTAPVASHDHMIEICEVFFEQKPAFASSIQHKTAIVYNVFA